MNLGEADLIVPWERTLLAWNLAGTRSLDFDTGATKWNDSFALGMDGSCIIEDVLVGSMPEHVHAVDLSRREPLWTKPWLVTQPPATDGSAAVFADQAVWCVELRSGKVRWEHTEEELGKGAMHMGCIWGGMYVVRVGRPRRLTAFDLQSGTTVWRADAGGFFWFQPYGDHAYCFDLDGEYVVLTLANGKEVFRKSIGKTVPEAIRTPKKGLMIGTSGAEPESWRDVRVAVSETHVFLQNASGQIVVLGRETGEVEQVVEIDGMPMGRTEPIIYRNHLLLADFNARVYCFEGASGASGLE